MTNLFILNKRHWKLFFDEEETAGFMGISGRPPAITSISWEKLQHSFCT